MKHERITARSAQEFKIIRWAAVLAFALLICDQVTKLIVEQSMSRGDSIAVIKGFFSLTYVTNKGAAWGMFHGYGMVLFAVGVLVMATALCFLRKLCDGFKERYFASMVVLSGVLGNSIDRVWRGEVVDFLDCYVKDYHWPAFNIADCAICIGIAIYTLSVMVRPTPEKDKAGKNDAA